MEFSKPALTAQQHLDLLVERKLKINDPDRTLHYIQYIGYFRLTGYMYPLQTSDGEHEFKTGASFEQVIDFYNFDRKLRFLILDFIERIEVALRAVISDTYALAHGAHWYLDANLFGDVAIHSNFTAQVKHFCHDCEFQFIKAYKNKYDKPSEPPIWMIILSCMIKMMDKANPTSDFKNKLKGLFAEYSEININYMGFQDGWEEGVIWK